MAVRVPETLKLCNLNLQEELMLKYASIIQSDSGGICINLGNDSMSDSKQKVHTNIGPILNGYGVMGIF